jgi:UTP--glucose-1-phosphate uridylyltransferase
MKIHKAVITAAGPDQRHLPLQTIVSATGETKPAIQILLDEIFAAGIRNAALIVAPGQTDAFRAAVGPHLPQIEFIEQPEPLGYGHAVLCAKAFTGDEAFLLLVGDHLYLSNGETSCVRQLLETAAGEGCAVSAVQSTREGKLPFYGTVGGKHIPGVRDLYHIENILEKPTPTVAEQELITPGLRQGHYLCFFGMHVLTATTMRLLEEALETSGKNLLLTPSLAAAAKAERHLAFEIAGQRYNIGEPYGLLRAQLALALAGPQRDEILTMLVELMATSR